MKILIKWIKVVFNPVIIKQILQGLYSNIKDNCNPVTLQRRKICKDCNNRIEICNAYFCDICGCSIKIKTASKNAKCPENKW